VLDAARSVVVRLDPRTARPVGAPVPVPAQPVALAADEREVWVVSSARHVATRIDARTGRTIDEIGVGRSPSSVALTPRFAWVAGARGAVTRLPRA
jgi:streptogramin lyase